MSEVMRLPLTRAVVQVIVETEDGQERMWELRELDGKERNSYLNKMAGRLRTDKGGKPVGMKSFDGFQSDLLTLCLRDEHGEPMTKQAIEDLPSKAQQALFEKAQELSGLNVEDEGKND